MEKLAMMFAITGRQNAVLNERIYRSAGSNFQITIYGSGGASSEMLETLGLSSNAKCVSIGLIRSSQTGFLFETFTRKLRIGKGTGNGILFTIPLTSLVGTYSYKFLANQMGDVKMDDKTNKTAEVKNPEINFHIGKYDLVYVIVNADYVDTAINASKAAGARGATVINAKGSGSPEASLLLGISVQPEKAVILLVIEHQIKEAVMTEVAKVVGLSTPGQGIIFATSIDEAYGMVGTLK